MDDGPPPPPPPHGEKPNTTHGEYRKSSDLPQGNYDIFVIPPHSSGAGFLYLPSLQCQRNSFLAGSACTLVAVYMWMTLSPIIRLWYATTITNGGGTGIAVVAVGVVGVAGWAFGNYQAGTGGTPQGRRGGGPGFGPNWFGSGGPGAAGANDPGGAGASHSRGGSYGSHAGGPHQQGNYGGNFAGGPPPGNQYSGNQYRTNDDPPPQTTPGPNPTPGPEPGPPPGPNPSAGPSAKPESSGPQSDSKPKTADDWEKTREETRRKEELRRKMEEFKRKREAEAREKERQREAEEREKERQREREKMEKELRERREQLEREMAAAREAAAKEARLQAEKEAAAHRARLEREAAEAKARAERLADITRKREAEARARAEREAAEARAKAEKEAAEAKAKAEKETAEKEAAAKAAAKKEADAKFAALKEAAAKKYAEKKARDAAAKEAAATASKVSSASAPPPRTPSPKKPAAPQSKASAPTVDDDAYSFRPYDRPRRPYGGTEKSSVYSESSYAPSQSTARTTPPPSHRGPYETKDPDKIVIKGVYAFNNAFLRTPVAQLVSGEGMVTDGLVLRITTEGLFIDDDLRGVPQREWDVKAWTMKLVEVWCHRVGPPKPNAPKANQAFFRRSNENPTSEESDAYLANFLKVCKNTCRLASPAFLSRSSTDSKDTRPHDGLHVLRATIRDQEGRRYVFVVQETEGWKVALGLQRLRKGSQVRALGVCGMALAETRTILSGLGY